MKSTPEVPVRGFTLCIRKEPTGQRLDLTVSKLPFVMPEIEDKIPRHFWRVTPLHAVEEPNASKQSWLLTNKFAST